MNFYCNSWPFPWWPSCYPWHGLFGCFLGFTTYVIIYVGLKCPYFNSLDLYNSFFVFEWGLHSRGFSYLRVTYLVALSGSQSMWLFVWGLSVHILIFLIYLTHFLFLSGAYILVVSLTCVPLIWMSVCACPSVFFCLF